jgi:hypothetical protein
MAEVLHSLFTALAASVLVAVVLLAGVVVAAGLLEGWRRG